MLSDNWFPARSLDGKGRCCGRKPIPYKRPYPHAFCCRCCADYDPATGRQIPNWAWLTAEGGGFRPRHDPDDGNLAGDYVLLARRALAEAEGRE